MSRYRPGQLQHVFLERSLASCCHGALYTGTMFRSSIPFPACSVLPSRSRIVMPGGRFPARPRMGARRPSHDQPAGRVHAAGRCSRVSAQRRRPSSEIEYLGPEPDRWRSPAEPELDAAQAPEHFIDLELADALGPLPHKRFDFEAKVFAAGERPEKIGLQPWETDEVWERLKAAMRQYRLSCGRRPGHQGRSRRRSSSMPAGLAIMSATDRSRCT